MEHWADVAVDVGAVMDIDDSLEIYIREVNTAPLLLETEERDLFHRMKAGDRDAWDKVVRSNLRLVLNLALS